MKIIKSFKLFEKLDIKKLNSELIAAATSNDTHYAEKLIADGADVNCIHPSYIEESPLTIASEYGNENMVDLLV